MGTTTASIRGITVIFQPRVSIVASARKSTGGSETSPSRSTLAAYQAANNRSWAPSSTRRVCTRSSSILSGRNVYSCRCRFLRSASHGGRSDGALGKNINVVLLSPDLPSGMISHRFYVHRWRLLDSYRINWRQYYFVRPMRHDQAHSWLFRL